MQKLGQMQLLNTAAVARLEEQPMVGTIAKVTEIEPGVAKKRFDPEKISLLSNDLLRAGVFLNLIGMGRVCNDINGIAKLECDPRHEFKMQRTLYRYWQRESEKNIFVPEPFSFDSESVTMEFIHSFPLLSPAPPDVRRRLAESLIRFHFGNTQHLGVMQTDLNATNSGRSQTGDLVCYDFGSVLPVSAEMNLALRFVRHLLRDEPEAEIPDSVIGVLGALPNMSWFLPFSRKGNQRFSQDLWTSMPSVLTSTDVAMKGTNNLSLYGRAAWQLIRLLCILDVDIDADAIITSVENEKISL